MSKRTSLFNTVRNKFREIYIRILISSLACLFLACILLVLYGSNEIAFFIWAVVGIVFFMLIIFLSFQLSREGKYKKFLKNASKIADVKYLDKTLSKIPNHPLAEGILRYNDEYLFYLNGLSAQIIRVDKIAAVGLNTTDDRRKKFCITILTYENEEIRIFANDDKRTSKLHKELQKLKHE